MVICGSRRDDQQDLLKSIERLNQQKQGTAFHHVRENIDDLNGRVGARDTDLIFLKGLMQSPIMSSLVKLQDRLEVSNRSVNPVATGNQQLVKEVRTTCRKVGLKEAQELADILSNPHFGSMLDAHDIIATKSYEPHNESAEKPGSYHNNSLGAPSGSTSDGSPTNGLHSSSDIRLVGIRKNEDEPLGITVKVEDDKLQIARILAGGIIDRQGLLHVGDTIMEVNGIDVHTPEQLSAHLKKAQGSVTFKIMPSFHDSIPPAPCYLKALYSYDPAKDTLLPCKEIGLKFNQGDILQIVNQEDPNWWQARKVGSLGPAYLIPSQELEERRRAFVRPEFDYATKTGICGTRVTKKKRKTMYQSKANADFDKAELLLYEEVARMPPFDRKTLVLIGAQGVGRRSLKSKLIASDPRRFAAPLPHTSRPIKEDEEDGLNYFFVTRESMEADIAENKYLEWGEHGEHIYGTKLDSIRAIIRSGRMCILDCNPQSLKMLKTSEFMPYVVFIAAPHTDQLRQMHEYGKHHGYASMRSLTFERAMGRHGSRRARTLESLASIYEDEDLRATIEESGRLQRAYEKYFDGTLVNNNFDKTFEQLREAIDCLSTESQWVPVSWVY